MLRRRFLLGFLLCLTLDLSSPFIAGAFSFDPDDCVDGVHHRTSSSTERADASALPARGPALRFALPSPSPVRPFAGGRHTILEWLVVSREDAHAAGDSPAPSDDH
jgi:hypothetical protein